jgi:high affinity Mn2+ porin
MGSRAIIAAILNKAVPSVDVTPDYQYLENPGYHRDRGPAHVFALRLRLAF